MKQIKWSSLLLAGFLFSTAAPSFGQGVQRVPVLIGFVDAPNERDIANLQRAGGKVTRTFNIVHAVAAELPLAALNGLQRNPRISVIEEDGQVFANVDAAPGEYNNVWGVKQVKAPAAHAAGNQGAGIKIAVLDSGVDYNHPDLAGRYFGGKDFVNNDNDPMDDNGHGTHVAGTIAAIPTVGPAIGVAPEVQIYALKVLGANGSGSFSAIIAAVEWCAANGIFISNNSYGADRDPGTLVKSAFLKSANAGVLHIAAAGNTGTRAGKGDNVGYPAKYDSVVAVAATDSANLRGTFSSTGPKVELAAPGVNVFSTVPNGQYATWNGTSMASPHAAGVAALVWFDLFNRNIDVNGDGTLNKDDVRRRLQLTAIDLGTKGRDTLYGFGLVQAP